MTSSSLYRQRVLSLAGNGQCTALQPHFVDAASACKTKEAAMAYGYLLGRSDATNNVPMPSPPINTEVSIVIQQYDSGKLGLSEATKTVFGLIYKWLDRVYDAEEYESHDEDDCGARWYLANAFQPFVKPGVITPPLPEKEDE